uniref:dITP/XTP pyrophosphatase n=1 Tax=Staphylothermus marinus TaxID=2280 RepID=A0A7J3KGA8_STAMA
MNEIVFVTRNEYKVREVEPIASKYGFKIVQTNLPKLEIQSEDLVKIAKTAALTSYASLNKPLFVEDAGLFIEALNGFPGPYSSYVYRTIGCKGILKLLENCNDRNACFKSVVVLIYEPFIVIEEGEVCGYISREPRGTGGFGFDPIFVPHGSSKTFAEMSIEEKNRFSHRGRAVDKAFKRLLSLLKENTSLR